MRLYRAPRHLFSLLLAVLAIAAAVHVCHAQDDGNTDSRRRIVPGIRTNIFPIETILRDANGDRIPDAVGDTVTIAGRATVSSGQIHNNWTEVYVQDETAGIKLVASSADLSVTAGDSILARGRLDFELGMAQITDPVYQRVDVPRANPGPLKVSVVDDRGLEPYEGRLIELKGTVAAQIPTEGGSNLILLVSDKLISIFAYASRDTPLSFDGYEIGDYLSVTGVAGQFDRRAPYNASYQIFPRAASDVRKAGLSPSWYRTAAVIVGLLFLLALFWAWLLRKQVQNRVSQLQVSEGRYDKLFNAAGDCMFIHQNSTNGRIIDANRMAVRTLGYTSAEFQQLTLTSLASGGSANSVADHLIRAHELGGSLSNMELMTKDGNPLLFEIRSHTFDFRGVPALLSIARDVSQRRAFEDGLLAAKRKAEEMAQLKTAFFVNMSHEIRTPLTAIIGAAELLLDEVDDDQKEFAKAVEQGGKRLLDTLNSVLDLTQLDAGEIAIRLNDEDAVQLVEDVVQAHQSLAEGKGLEIFFEPAESKIPCYIDAANTRHVLDVILENAIKFTHSGGVRVKVKSENSLLHIHIADTGIGISEEFIPDLFTEFKQESEGISRDYEGSGLGLSIAQRLVNLMNGSIRVLSRKGVGSMFIVSLPLFSEQTDDPPSASRQAATASPMA